MFTDIPAGWLAIATMVLTGIGAAFKLWRDAHISELANKDKVIATLQAKIDSMQEKIIEGLNVQLEAAQKRSATDDKIALTIQDLSAVVRSIAGKPT